MIYEQLVILSLSCLDGKGVFTSLPFTMRDYNAWTWEGADVNVKQRLFLHVVKAVETQLYLK
jgi:hypothetical protein